MLQKANQENKKKRLWLCSALGRREVVRVCHAFLSLQQSGIDYHNQFDKEIANRSHHKHLRDIGHFFFFFFFFVAAQLLSVLVSALLSMSEFSF